jgi:predicted HicB family RNase H-like nuclease
MMEYKGYIGKVEFDDEASIFHGDVINTHDVITFQGKSVAELKKAFRDSIDDYLAFCQERGEEPDKPFSGQFVTRISPDLHRRASLAASLAGKSLNAWVAEQLQSAVDSENKSRSRSKQKTSTEPRPPAKGARRSSRK